MVDWYEKKAFLFVPVWVARNSRPFSSLVSSTHYLFTPFLALLSSLRAKREYLTLYANSKAMNKILMFALCFPLCGRMHGLLCFWRSFNSRKFLQNVSSGTWLAVRRNYKTMLSLMLTVLWDLQSYGDEREIKNNIKEQIHSHDTKKITQHTTWTWSFVDDGLCAKYRETEWQGEREERERERKKENERKLIRV